MFLIYTPDEFFVVLEILNLLPILISLTFHICMERRYVFKYDTFWAKVRFDSTMADVTLKDWTSLILCL